jgi:superfamily I DNA/RNA helicase
MSRFVSIDLEKKNTILLATEANLTDQQKAFTALGDVDDTESAHLYVLQAVAGAGKTKSVSRLVSRVVMNGNIHDFKLMSSLRTSAAAAGEAIATAFKETGLVEYGSIPNFCIRTIHSLALAQQRMAGQPTNIVFSAKPFISDVLDELALPARLVELHADNEVEAWDIILHKFQPDEVHHHAKKHRALIENIQKTCESTIAMVSEYVRTTQRSTGEKHFRQIEFERPSPDERGFEMCIHPVHEDIVKQVDVIRTEVLNRGLDTANLTDTIKTMLAMTEQRMDEAAGSVDFTQLIRRFASSGQPVVGSGSVLIVDEAQDLTDAQLRVVKSTLLAGATVFLVGDVSQGICSFAGSSFNPIGDAIEWAQENEIATTVSGLTHNFRSTEDIIRASEAVLPEEDRALRGEVTGLPNDPKYLAPRYINYASDVQEYSSVAESIVAMIRKGVPPGDIAVLRFKNWTMNHPLIQGLLKPSDGGLGVKVKILGSVTSGSLLSEKIACAFRVAMGTEDLEDMFEASKMLQLACRMLNQCNFPDDLAKLVKETAEQKLCTPEHAMFEHQDEIMSKARAILVETGSKRALNGDSDRVKNYQKYLSIGKTALLSLREVLCQMFADPASGKLSTLTKRPSDVDRPKGGLKPPPAGLIAVNHPLGKVARHFLVHQARPIKTTEVEDVNNILIRFNVAVEEGAEIPATIERLVDDHLDMVNGKNEAESVLFSTGHRMKGRQRLRVFATDMGKGFDSIRIDANKLRAHGSISDSKESDELYDKAVEHANKERKRLAHVILSRPRYELCVSGSGGGRVFEAFKAEGIETKNLGYIV